MRRPKHFNKFTVRWDQIWKLPIHMQEFSGGHVGRYAWSANDVMALTFEKDTSPEFRQLVVDAINGTKDVKVPEVSHDGPEFSSGGKPIFSVRGWGNLTGVGALRLDVKSATRIQDDFINHILKTLS